MTARVWYRKWRPQHLDEVVGQEPVVRTLRQAIAQGRVAHAYLFCGPRGTGKTSTARILAKAINCQAPQDGQPCNACHLCTPISEGVALDLVEIDAASNRGIDDIRNLRERVHYAPAQARYKVYIIDEVHMLTEAAFNALLKTLEEPPAHAIFVLATTEPHKVPATIISRCQRFDFRRIPPAAAVARLRHICEGEGIQATEGALRAIARAAGGSLRDATNILEQLLVSYGQDLGAAQVQALLGTGDEERALELAEHAIAGRLQEGLGAIHAVAREGLDLRQFHRLVVEYLRVALLIKSGAGETLDYPAETLERLRAVASPLSPDYLVRQVKLFSQAGIRQDNPSPLPLELALVESALAGASFIPPSAQRRGREPTAPPPPTASPAAGVATPRQEVAPPPHSPQSPEDGRPSGIPSGGEHAPPTPAPTEPVEAGTLEARWPKLLENLRRKKGRRFFIGALLRDCRTRHLEDQTLVLGFRSHATMQRLETELATPEGRTVMAAGLEQVLGTPLEVRLTLVNDGTDTTPQGGHLVRLAMAKGGRIVEEEGEGP